MKKMAFGLLAVVVAVGSVAFTTATKSAKFACTDSPLIWFQVQANQGHLIGATIGNAIGSTDRGKLDLTPYVDLNALGTTPGDASITSADFPNSGSFDRIYTQTEAASTFCPTTGIYKCAVAFLVDGTPSGEFEIVSGKVVPKTTAVVQCVINRNVQ